MKQFIVSGDVFYNGEFFAKAEREIWAETANAAKMEFERANKGSGFTVKDLRIKELK